MKKILLLVTVLLVLAAFPASAQVTGAVSGVKMPQSYVNTFTATSALTAGEIVKLDTAHPDQVVATTNADTSAPIGVAYESFAAGSKDWIVISGALDGVLKTENTCAIGNYVVVSNVSGGASGNSMCTASPSGAYAGYALSAATGTAGSPVAIDILVAPGTASSITPVSKWVNTAADGTQAGTTLGSANITRLFGFTLDVPVNFSHIVFNVGTTDTTSGSLCGAFADCYDVGIYNSGGTLQGHCAAMALNEAGVVDCGTTEGTVTLPPGFYYFAFTGNASVATVSTADGNSFASDTVPSAGSSTTNGALNSSMTPPSDSWNLLTGRQMIFSLHN